MFHIVYFLFSLMMATFSDAFADVMLMGCRYGKGPCHQTGQPDYLDRSNPTNLHHIALRLIQPNLLSSDMPSPRVSPQILNAVVGAPVALVG